jgi:Fe-S cluster assembly protein SufD
MLENIKFELIDKDEDYIIAQNGNIIYKSKQDLDFHFKNNMDIKVIHLVDEDAKISYVISSNNNVKISEVFYSVTSNSNIEIEIKVEKSGKCDYTSLRRNNDSSQNKANVNAYLEEDSYLNYKTISSYTSDGMFNENFYLNAINSYADIQNVIINTAKKVQEYNININHNAKHSISNLLNYGICKNESSLKINSKGIIKQGSHKAEIRQKAKGLLLDEVSTLSANPLLEIDDFDVIANHGASIGAIDEDELYYLMSRGLTKDESEKLIVSGFINPVLSTIKEGKLQEFVSNWINKNI